MDAKYAAVTHGLVNKAGENNCFVNAIIQILWHLDVFRIQFQRINHHSPCQELIQQQNNTNLNNDHQNQNENHHQEEAGEIGVGDGVGIGPELEETKVEEPELIDPLLETNSKKKEMPQQDKEAEKKKKKDELDSRQCIVCALAGLFLNFKYSNQATLPPTYVRKALSNVFEEGKMHSALECFEQVLEEIKAKQCYSLPEKLQHKLILIQEALDALRKKASEEGEEDIEAMNSLEEDRQGLQSEMDDKRNLIVQDIFSQSVCETKFCKCGGTSEPFVNSGTFFHISVADLLENQKRLKKNKKQSLQEKRKKQQREAKEIEARERRERLERARASASNSREGFMQIPSSDGTGQVSLVPMSRSMKHSKSNHYQPNSLGFSLRFPTFKDSFVKEKESDLEVTFAELLHDCFSQGKYPCPNQKEGETRVKCPFNEARILTSLLDTPKTLLLSVSWQAEFTDRPIIAAFSRSISEEIDLTKVFDYYPGLERSETLRVSEEGKKYKLMGMVTYYGKHYTAFVYHSKYQTWIYCDDDKVRKIGDWKKVVDELLRLKQQVEIMVYSSKQLDV